MSMLYEMVRNLLVIIIIASFLELILPDGKMRPFVRFAVGLFILIAILSPTLGVLFKDRGLELVFWDYQLDDGTQQAVQTQGEKLQEKIYQPQPEVIQSKLQGQIDAISSLVPGVNRVSSRVETNPDGSVKKVTLRVETGSSERVEKVAGVRVFSNVPKPADTAGQQAIAEKITQLIGNLYEIPQDKVKIDFGGG